MPLKKVSSNSGADQPGFSGPTIAIGSQSRFSSYPVKPGLAHTCPLDTAA